MNIELSTIVLFYNFSLRFYFQLFYIISHQCATTVRTDCIYVAMCPTCNGHGLSSAALVVKTGFTFVVRFVLIVVVVALFIIIMIIVVGYFSDFYEFAWQHF